MEKYLVVWFAFFEVDVFGFERGGEVGKGFMEEVGEKEEGGSLIESLCLWKLTYRHILAFDSVEGGGRRRMRKLIIHTYIIITMNQRTPSSRKVILLKHRHFATSFGQSSSRCTTTNSSSYVIFTTSHSLAIYQQYSTLTKHTQDLAIKTIKI